MLNCTCCRWQSFGHLILWTFSNLKTPSQDFEAFGKDLIHKLAASSDNSDVADIWTMPSRTDTVWKYYFFILSFINFYKFHIKPNSGQNLLTELGNFPSLPIHHCRLLQNVRLLGSWVLRKLFPSHRTRVFLDNTSTDKGRNILCRKYNLLRCNSSHELCSNDRSHPALVQNPKSHSNTHILWKSTDRNLWHI